MSLKLPSEIVKEHPGISKHWTANDLGYLFKLKLIRGKRKERKNYIEERDIIRLFSSRIS